MSKDNIIKLIQPGNVDDQLTEILRNGARALLAQAIEAAVSDFLGKHGDLKTADGRQRVEKEAKLIALACSQPPKGRVRWTLRLSENKVVELGIADRASDSTIGHALKRTLSSPIADSSGSFRRRRTARS